jgi:hypothetical protein
MVFKSLYDDSIKTGPLFYLVISTTEYGMSLSTSFPLVHLNSYITKKITASGELVYLGNIL